MASCLLILQYVSFESSYDQFHTKKDRVFRVDTEILQQGERKGQSKNSSYLLAPTIVETVPGVTKQTRTHLQYYGAVVTYEEAYSERRQFFEEDREMYFVDQNFFDLFDYELIKGNRETLLTEPMSIVVTQSAIEKYMPGVADPVGKFLKVDGGWYPGTYKITGILADLPGNTLFDFQFLMPIHDLLKNGQYSEDDGWGWSNFESYVLIDESANPAEVAEGARDIKNEREKERLEATNGKLNVVFTPLSDIHLRDPAMEGSVGVSDKTLFLFVVIAIFIIGIAWLNYINLATAQAMTRAKEIGIRKVVGAVRKQLIFQFLLEAFVINVIALAIALAIAYASLPLLGSLMDKSLAFGTGIKTIEWFIFGVVFIIGTLLSGFYPALVLSGFRPTVVIKGAAFASHRKFGLRQVLVVAQLIIGVFLISGTLAVYKQLQFMRTRDLGMKVEQVISIRGPRVFDEGEQVQQKIKAFKQTLRGLPAISQVSGSEAIPGGDHNWGMTIVKDGQDRSEAQPAKMMWVDENFHKTYGMELLAGRFHSMDLRGEENQVVVNETLIQKFNMGTPEEAVGQKMRVGESVFPIIGVLKDYHWYSLKAEKEPILLNYTEVGSNISVKLATGEIHNTLEEIGAQYESQFPGNPFDYYFMDDFYQRQYKADQQFGKIFSIFSGIAVVIACLGLFGLASFTLNLRIREIGIRKVLGASLSSILLMIYKDYMKLILIAAVLGLPVVYFAIQNWLESYANRISITADLMVLPILLLMLITIGTIGYQSVKTATANPSKSLRSE